MSELPLLCCFPVCCGGREEIRKTIDKNVDVYCPFCCCRQACKLKELAAYRTCLFVPYRRLGEITKYYKCLKCKNRFPFYGPKFDFEQQENDKKQQQQQQQQRMAMEFLLLTCMIRVRMANGAFRLQPEGVAVGQQFLIFAQTVVDSGHVMERNLFMKNITGYFGLKEDLLPAAIRLLTEEQKEHLLRAMSHVTLSSPKRNIPNTNEAKVFEQVGKMLGLEETIIAKYTKKKIKGKATTAIKK